MVCSGKWCSLLWIMDCLTVGAFAYRHHKYNLCNSFQGQPGIISFFYLISSFTIIDLYSRFYKVSVWETWSKTADNFSSGGDYPFLVALSAQLHENAPLAAPSLPSSRYHPTFSIKPRPPVPSSLFSHNFFKVNRD